MSDTHLRVPRTKVLATGMVNVDVLAVDLPHVAPAGRVVYCSTPIRTQIGGHPVDVAIDLLNLGYPREDVAVAVALGNGVYADLVRGIMEEHGLDAYVKDVASVDTGTNLVLKVAGEDRRFHLDPGANWHLDAGHVVDAIRDYSPDIFCIRGGYTAFDNDMHNVLQAVNGLTFLDICPPHPDRGIDFLVDAIPHADLVHCNAIELQLVSGKSTTREGAKWLLDFGVQLAFVSSGEAGIMAINQHAAVEQDAFVVDAVDPTGAGDAFCAGVVHEIARRPNLRSALGTLGEEELAEFIVRPQAVGAAAATVVGCTGGATTTAVEHLMQSQGADVLRSSRAPHW